jgi:hypothetical protein
VRCERYNGAHLKRIAIAGKNSCQLPQRERSIPAARRTIAYAPGIMSKFLQRLFGPKPSIQHAVFGRLILRQGKKGPYWMHDAYAAGELTITIETSEGQAPSAQQVAFFQRITGDLDATFRLVSERLIPTYERNLKRAFPSNWRDIFSLAGIRIPIDGNDRLSWGITFELRADNLGYLFTCYFEHGLIKHVGMDT